MQTQRPRKPLERNMGMELVRITEAAALAAALHMGKGDKELVDQAAVDAMRFTLGSMQMDGIVVNGVDIMTFNEEGKITEFKVMVRPLKAVNLMHAKMKAMLEQLPTE